MARTEPSETWADQISRSPSQTEELKLADLAQAYGALMPAAHVPFSVSFSRLRERADADRSI
jgi:hypothetical protein